jgi:periplasmic divalent cation tolerance protein
MSEYVVVLVTVASDEEGRIIAAALVEEKLAACASLIMPVRSFYRWEGVLQDETEGMLVIKTGAAMLERLTERVKALHSYDLPEVIALPIIGGSQGYLDWLGNETKP